MQYIILYNIVGSINPRVPLTSIQKNHGLILVNKIASRLNEYAWAFLAVIAYIIQYNNNLQSIALLCIHYK